MGDIFDCLAGDFPVDNFCADKGDKHGAKVTPAELRERARKLVYIVGSGTFQSVFDSAKKRSVGFGNQPNGEADFEAIVASGIVSRELLARFHAPAFVLRAPTVDEVRELYERNGLAQLAREVSYTFTAADYDLQRTGFRSVESLATKLLLLRRKRILAAAAELPTPPPLSLSR